MRPFGQLPGGRSVSKSHSLICRLSRPDNRFSLHDHFVNNCCIGEARSAVERPEIHLGVWYIDNELQVWGDEEHPEFLLCSGGY